MNKHWKMVTPPLVKLILYSKANL